MRETSISAADALSLGKTLSTLLLSTKEITDKLYLIDEPIRSDIRASANRIISCCEELAQMAFAKIDDTNT